MWRVPKAKDKFFLCILQGPIALANQQGDEGDGLSWTIGEVLGRNQ